MKFLYGSLFEVVYKAIHNKYKERVHTKRWNEPKRPTKMIKDIEATYKKPSVPILSNFSPKNSMKLGTFIK